MIPPRYRRADNGDSDYTCRIMKVFGLLVDWVSSNYQTMILSGIQTYCRENGVNLLTLVMGRPGSPARWKLASERLQQFIREQRIDGFLVMTATLKNTLGEEQTQGLLESISSYPLVSL